MPRTNDLRRVAIVVGTDGSETAALAVRRAADLARTTGAALHLVTVYTAEPAALSPAEEESVPPELRWMASAGHAADLVLEGASALAEGVGEIHRHARPGDPADVLLDVADEVDAALIVVGNKGMHGVKRFVVPSVPNQVSHRAGRDVLIVNTTSAA